MSPRLERVDLAPGSETCTAFAAFGTAMNARDARNLPRPVVRERALLDHAANPWLAEMELAAWLVRAGAGGPVIGRIAAMHPVGGGGEGASCLGLYEAEDDDRVARLLIEAGLDWLAARGAARALAPVDFSIFQGYRCQTGGFDAPPFVGEPRNPAYYGDHFGALGFTPLYRWETHDLDRDQAIVAAETVAGDYADARTLGYRFEDYRSCSGEEGLRRSWDLINASYGGMPGFSPLSWERFHEHYAHLPLLADRDASSFVYDPAGSLVGFCVVLKDVSAGLRAMRGHAGGLGVWLDRLRFFRHAGGGTMATAYQTGIPYREIRRAAVLGRRRLGRPLALGRALYYRVVSRIIRQDRYRRIVVALVREGSPNIGYSRPWASTHREYALYERPLS